MGVLAFSGSFVTCQAATLREGRSALCTSWPGVKPSPRGTPVGDSQLPGADVCGQETALLVWSVVGEAASTVCSRLRHGCCWVAGSNSRS